MAYILPQVKVAQDFQTVPSAAANPQNAFIFGENYHLFRCNVPEEKLLIGLGQYDPNNSTSYVWPNKPAGSVVDQSFSKLFFDDAWLEYLRDLVGSGHVIKAVDNFPNRINSSTLFFATTNNFSRSSELINRDVKVGDGVRIKGILGPDEFELVTKVRSLIADIIPSVTTAPVDDANNADTTLEGSADSLESGTPGTVTLASSAVGYDGSADGNTTESYFIEVTTAGAFGVAQLKVTSASGNDDNVDPVVPVDGSPFALGTRGATATFITVGSATPFEDGQVWKVAVTQAWTIAASALDTGNNYLGQNDGTYVITVTKGGLYATAPQVFVTSTGTLDDSGPYAVADGAGFTLPTGVKIKFSGGTGLALNDRYYVGVAAETAGAVHTLELTNSLPDLAYGISPGGPGSTTPVSIDLDLSLSIIKDTEIPRTSASLLENWLTSSTEVTVNSGITDTDASWTSAIGTLLPLPIILGGQCIQYRATNIGFEGKVGELEDIGDVEALLGPLDADNPLALGVFKAMENAAGTAVKFMSTGGPDLSDYLAILDTVFDRQDVYGFVPLTHDKNIQDAVASHVVSSSTDSRNRWRVAWYGAVIDEVTEVSTLDYTGNILLATILDDPATSGTQFTRVRSSNSRFLTDEVKPGQLYRTNFVTNPSTGEETFQEFVIDAVFTEEEIRLASGPNLAITVPSRFEIHKTNTESELADQVINLAGAFKNRRVRVVMPDKIGNAGEELDSMFLCCSLSGLRSGALPHQGLTNVQITGYDDAPRATELFGGAELNRMADNGVWIVTQDNAGQIFTRHQLTTDTTDINTREDSLVANIDSISKRFFDFFTGGGYIGLRNITEQLFAQLRADFGALVSTIQFESDTVDLGPQIITATIVSLERHPTLLDHIIANVDVDLPEPFNNFQINLTVPAS